MYLVLKKNNDFKRLYKVGKKSYANGLMMYYSSSTALKFGISVGKKYGGSVQRNRIKRLIRAAYRENLPKITQNVNIIFIPKAGFFHTYQNVFSSMRSLLIKEGLINNA